jgi:hypothetical protein
MKRISRSNSNFSNKSSFTNKVSEGRGKLHDFSGRPWIFRDDPVMEGDYQRDSVRSILFRLRPMWYFVVPLCWMWKILLFLSHFIFKQPWSNFEFMLSSTKVGLLSLFTVLCCIPWRKEHQGKVGELLVWMNRVFVLILLVHETCPRSSSETQIMFLLVLEMMLGAVITPTFCEYIAFSTTFALIKPVSTFLLGGTVSSAAVAMSNVASGRGGGSAEPLPQALAQHAILLFIAAGVNFRIHCDRRRIWLLSLSASRRSSGRRRHRNPADPTEFGSGGGQTQSSVAAAIASMELAEDDDDDAEEEGGGEEDPGWASGWCTCDSGGVAGECAEDGAAGPVAAERMAAMADPADWDGLRRDGYFTAEERAELAPMVHEERLEIRRRAHDAFHRDSGGGAGSGAELRWHHAKEIVGAGSFGYVYQARPAPRAGGCLLPWCAGRSFRPVSRRHCAAAWCLCAGRAKLGGAGRGAVGRVRAA